jgi:hypothetical protein
VGSVFGQVRHDQCGPPPAPPAQVGRDGSGARRLACRRSPSRRGTRGVLVLSRHPLTDYQTIEFDDCACIECMSRKGAILVSGSCAGTPFRLIATHLQGEEGTNFTASHQRVRDAQMAQIRDQLIVPHLEPSIPFLICGDLGTPRFTDDGLHETASYAKMLETFQAENGPDARITFSDSLLDNDMATDDTHRKNELDYIRAADLDLQPAQRVPNLRVAPPRIVGPSRAPAREDRPLCAAGPSSEPSSCRTCRRPADETRRGSSLGARSGSRPCVPRPSAPCP